MSTSCCGDYHYADCPSVDRYMEGDREWDYDDWVDDDPDQGWIDSGECCMSGDVNNVQPSGFGVCAHCGQDVDTGITGAP